MLGPANNGPVTDHGLASSLFLVMVVQLIGVVLKNQHNTILMRGGGVTVAMCRVTSSRKQVAWFTNTAAINLQSMDRGETD